MCWVQDSAAGQGNSSRTEITRTGHPRYTHSEQRYSPGAEVAEKTKIGGEEGTQTRPQV